MEASNQNIKKIMGNSFDLEDRRISDYRNRWENNPIRHVVEDFPLHLDIEVTNYCNLHCSFCASTIHGCGEKGFMDLGMFKQIIDESAKMQLPALKFNWRGEPLLHPDIVEMVAYAKDKGVLDVFFNTNGFFLNEALAEKLVDAKLDRIIFSVEGCEAKVYEKYRIGSNFERVKTNIETLKSIREKKKSHIPQIRIQTVSIPEIDEKKYVEFWGRYADEITIINQRDECEIYCKLDSSKWCCPYPWLRLTIAYDGNVYPCCFMTKSPELYDDDCLLGNVRELSIQELWKGEKMNKYRTENKAGNSESLKACKVCSYRNTELIRRSLA